MKKSITQIVLEKLKDKKSYDIDNLEHNDIQSLIQELDIYEAELLAQNEELQDSWEKLELENNHNKILFDNAPIPYIVIDKEFKIIKYNLEADRYFHLSSSLLQKRFYSLLTQGNFTSFMDWISGKTYHENPLEIATKTKEGVKNFIINCSNYNINKDGYYLLMFTDISTEKEYQKEIEEQKKEFETIFQYSKDGIAILDLETNFLDFNEAYLEMTGYNEKELLLKTCLDLTAKEYKEQTIELLENIAIEGFVRNIEKNYITKNNESITVNISLSLMPDKQRILLVAKDVTSLKQIEIQSKLLSMSEMISNIAHQWRQPLSIMTISASRLSLLTMSDDLKKEEIEKFLHTVSTQSKYLSQVIDSFRNIIEEDTSHLRINLQEVVINTLEMLETVFESEHVIVISDLDPELYILGDRNELTQVLLNIINNSIEIMKEKKSEEERLLSISLKPKDDNRIKLSIYDSGEGIDKDIINRVLEPYVTTKFQAKGIGNGLTICDKIIRERHNGDITIYNKKLIHNNKEYYGAEFTITLEKVD